MLSFECIKNEKSVYFLLTSAEKSENLSDYTQNPQLGDLSWAEMRHNKLYAQ